MQKMQKMQSASGYSTRLSWFSIPQCSPFHAIIRSNPISISVGFSILPSPARHSASKNPARSHNTTLSMCYYDMPLPLVMTGSAGLLDPPVAFARRVSGNGYSSGSSSSLQNRLALFTSPKSQNLRKLPRHIILCAQTFPPLLQTREVTRSHHSTSISWRSRNTEWSRNLLLDAWDEIIIVLIAK